MRYENRNWPTSSKFEIKRASLISHPLSLILELFGDEQGHPGHSRPRDYFRSAHSSAIFSPSPRWSYGLDLGMAGTLIGN